MNNNTANVGTALPTSGLDSTDQNDTDIEAALKAELERCRARELWLQREKRFDRFLLILGAIAIANLTYFVVKHSN